MERGLLIVLEHVLVTRLKEQCLKLVTFKVKSSVQTEENLRKEMKSSAIVLAGQCTFPLPSAGAPCRLTHMAIPRCVGVTIVH